MGVCFGKSLSLFVLSRKSFVLVFKNGLRSSIRFALKETKFYEENSCSSLCIFKRKAKIKLRNDFKNFPEDNGEELK